MNEPLSDVEAWRKQRIVAVLGRGVLEGRIPASLAKEVESVYREPIPEDLRAKT